MEVLGLGVELELQLLAYATATAMWDLSHVCNLYHSSGQRQILNPLRKRDQTHILMDTSWILHSLSHKGNSWASLLTLINKLLWKQLLRLGPKGLTVSASVSWKAALSP